MKHGSRKHKKIYKDFWRSWREEHRRWRENYQESNWEAGHQPHPASPEEAAHMWRDFFYSFMGDWPEHHWAFKGRRFTPWHQGDEDYNPFVASILSKGGGLLPLYVLHLLYLQPRYGNEIMNLISEKTTGHWTANPGAIYPLMTVLENQKLVEGRWEDPKKRTVRVYHITETGIRELAQISAIMLPKLRESIRVFENIAVDLEAVEYSLPNPSPGSKAGI